MNYEEINQRIFHYVAKDKTHSALMLTGDWGSGKSYYINNSLKEYLENNGQECFIISLYGFKELSEISKAIYLEVRIGKFKEKKLKKICDKLHIKSNPEGEKAGKIVAKTVLSSVANQFNIDLSQKEKDWQELYESIDLTGKLIVFEDIERCGIDIIEIMGYINHLVEQDGVKILLVTNEEELISEAELKESHEIKEKGSENQKTLSIVENSDGIKSYNYYKLKEKTISDTIIFIPDIRCTISSILDMLDNEKGYLQRYKTEELYKFFTDLYERLNSQDYTNGITGKLNFRIFIFATQKFLDILQFVDVNKNPQHFIDTIYYSIISFSSVLKTNKEVVWDEDYENDYSLKFGTQEHPLFKFCYDYIMYYTIPKEDDIKKSYDSYFRLRNFIQNKSKNDSDLLVLYYYYLHDEQQVRNALNSLKSKLMSPLTISFFEYCHLAKILIELSKILNFNYFEYEKLMYNNLLHYKNNSDVKKIIQETERQLSLLSADEKYEYLNEYYVYIEHMKSVFGKSNDSLIFPSNPADLSRYYNIIIRNRNKIFNNGYFLPYVNIPKFIVLLKKCTVKDVNRIREIFWAIYRPSNKSNTVLCKSDLQNLIKLRSSVDNYYNQFNGDKIMKYQLNLFIENLTYFIDNIVEQNTNQEKGKDEFI